LTVLSDYVARMVEAGMAQDEAMQIVAEVFAAGAANVVAKSSNAARQQRYRERKKAAESVTNRNETVTQRNAVNDAETVTNRNETVTTLRSEQNDIYLSSTTINSKEERKKDTAQRKRNAPLRDNWAPSQTSHRIAEQCGQDVRLVEQIFRDYLKSSGKLYADYDAAFNNFIRNQQRFNGAKNGKQPSQIIQAADNLRAKLASFDGRAGRQDGLRGGEGAPSPRLLSNG
jgi:hypothetical protein